MPVNMYDQPVQYQFLNTYVPVNFNELYRIGSTQNAAIQQAADNFYGALQKFGEFRSPSAVDTKAYYDKTINSRPIQNLVNRIAYDPNALKDASFRAQLQSAINGVDYAGLSLLRESADNLRQGLAMRAKMESEGRYNPNWDRSDIANYDTLGTGEVFSDITPIRFMTANELSDQYFNNLEPSSLGPVTKNGIVYDVSGITYDTLMNISNARFNDLIATPQGQMYYEQFLKANNGNADAAKQAFVGMIADSQRDRIRNIETINPLWLAEQKARLSARYSARSRGTGEQIDPQLLRRQRYTLAYADKLNNLYGTYGYSRYVDDNGEARDGYVEKMQQRIQKGDKDAQAELNAYEDAMFQLYGDSQTPGATQIRMQYGALAARHPDNPLVRKAYDEAIAQEARLQDIVGKQKSGAMYRDIFQNLYDPSGKKDIVNIDTEDRNYDANKYRTAVNETIRTISEPSDILFRDGGDPLLISGSGAQPATITSKNGITRSVYSYPDSDGFMLNEQFLQQTAGIANRRVNQNWFWGFDEDKWSNLGTMISSGLFTDVTFDPRDRGYLRYGNSDYIAGSLEIPLEQFYDAIGKGYGLIFGESTKKEILPEQFGAKIVERQVGNETKEYVQLDALRPLAPNGSVTDVPINVQEPHDLGAGTTASKEALATQNNIFITR